MSNGPKAILGLLTITLVVFIHFTAYCETADIILHKGNIITLEEKSGNVSAVAIKGERILGLGSDGEILKTAGQGTKIIDLEGKTVIPGFNDSHVHIIKSGISMSKVSLGETTSISEVQEAIRSFIQENKIPAGKWVVSSSDWYTNQLKENRFPTRLELDKVSPQNPVFLPRGGHQSASNSVALKLAGISKETPSPKGGEIVKDSQTGEPTGVLIDEAQKAVTDLIPKEGEEESLEALRKVQALAHSFGITSMVDGGATLKEWAILEKFRKSGQMKIRIAARMAAPNKNEFLKINQALTPQTGDQWLKVGPLKMLLDGGSTGTLFTQPYANDPKFYGVQITPTQDLKEVSALASQNDWRVSVHCQGDKAFDILLDAWEEVNGKKSIVGKRWTVEHGKNIRQDQLRRVKDLGLMVTIQAPAYVKGETYIKNFGMERAGRDSPGRDYLNNGIMLAGGSDWLTNPLNPFIHMYFAVARKTKAGTIMVKEQALTAKEALSMETKYAAYVTYEENLKGTIAPGKLADLAVLSQDPLKASPEDLKNTKVLMTLVGGEIVYQAK